MSDLRDLPDLARDVSERVVTPPYDEVSRRVRARLLRGAAGSLAAAVLVIGGVAVWQNAATTASPRPRPPATQPAEPTDETWREVVAGEGAHPLEQAGTADGSIAVIWRNPVHPEPTLALVIRRPDGSVVGDVIDTPVTLTPVPGGWVGVSTARGWFIGTDATWTDLGQPGAPRRSVRGDVYVGGGQYGSWLYSPQDRSWATIPMPDGNVYDGYVTTTEGALVTCGGDGQGHVWVSTDRHQSPTIRGHACVMAGRGGSIVAAGLGDRPDGSMPLTGLLRSTGDQLTFTRADFTRLGGVSSIVVTTDGSTLVTGEDGSAFLLSADSGQLVAPDRPLGVAFAAGDRVYALSYAQNKGPLLVSDDDGATWQETLLPGMESSEE